MTATLAASLAVLALVDSTSFGTLLIPVWLMLHPRLRPGRVLVFLGTVGGFYLLLGVALLAGATFLLDGGAGLLDHPVVIRLQLVLGVGMLIGSFFMGKPRTDEHGQPVPGRADRWRARIMADGGGGSGGLVTLALTAAAVEAASMLPYLAATGLLSTSGLSWPGRLAALVAYCTVMILPALILLAVRVPAGRLVEPLLRRIARWMEKNAASATGWIVGILGFLLARDALGRSPEIAGLLGG